MRETIAIVGASLAGARAAEALRDSGFTGRVVLIGDEPDQPYDRPPLSKQVLTGEWDEDDIALVSPQDWDDLDVTVRLSTRAIGVDVSRRGLQLDDGSSLSYDGLIIATGARARTFATGTGPGVHVLRTLADAHRLGSALAESGQSIGIVGGGFIGSEVAYAAKALGNSVTVLERGPGPMAQVLGERVAVELAALQAAHDVDLRTDVAVSDVRPAAGDGRSRAEVVLGGGEVMRFDEVLVSIGAVPNVEWLASSALRVEGGLVCDESLFAADGVVGAGDVVRIVDGDGRLRHRIEHWTDSARQAEVAAANLLSGRENATKFGGLGYVWSDQFKVRIEVIGDPTAGTVVEDVPGNAEPAGTSWLFRYARGDETVAFVTIAQPKVALGIRRLATDPAALSRLRAKDVSLPA